MSYNNHETSVYIFLVYYYINFKDIPEYVYRLDLSTLTILYKALMYVWTLASMVES